MNFIDKILEYVESEPKAVIIVLLGIITGGTIGGGLVIRSLQATIEHKEKIISEHEQLSKEEIAINESRGQMNIAAYKQKNDVLNKAISEFKKGISAYSSTTDKIICSFDKLLLKKNIDSKDKIIISESIKIIRNQQEGVEKAVDKAELYLKISSEIQELQEMAAKKSKGKN